MKNLLTLFYALFFSIYLSAQTTVTINNNSSFDVLMELGWNDNTVPPFGTSFKAHTPDWHCIPSGGSVFLPSPPTPNLDIFKGFKTYCPSWGVCSTAMTYTDNGPWLGDPGVAPTWHFGFLLPFGSINHYDCSGNLIGTIDWSYSSTGWPYPYGDFTITIN